MSDFTTIPLSKQGKTKGLYETIVSPEDADLALFRWTAFRGGKSEQMYVIRTIPPNYERIHLHRIIIERMQDGKPLEKGQFVDHISGDTLDNRRGNLRIATKRQNMANSRLKKNNTSGFRGVSWSKGDKKWKAEIRINGKKKFLGNFDKKEDAAKVYQDKYLELYQEYARQEASS